MKLLGGRVTITIARFNATVNEGGETSIDHTVTPIRIAGASNNVPDADIDTDRSTDSHDECGNASATMTSPLNRSWQSDEPPQGL